MMTVVHVRALINISHDTINKCCNVTVIFITRSLS